MTHPEYPLSAPCRTEALHICCFIFLMGVLTLLIIFYSIHIPGDRNLCQYTEERFAEMHFCWRLCISPQLIAIAVITIFPLYMTYLDAKAAATLRMLLVFLWIWTCSFYKFDAVVSIF